MRIAAVETFVLSNRRALVRIETDGGLVGWGEPVLENWALSVIAAVERMAEHLLGADPRRITHLWQVLGRGGFYRGGAVLQSALSGIDQALWDLRGRALGAPVHELLGGACRDEVRVYAHANAGPGRTGDPELARRLVAEGYTMLKVAPDGPVSFLDTPASIERLVADLGELRRAVGPGVDLALDMHGRMSLPMSRRVLPLLEPLLPVFVEEPLRPEHSALIGELVRASGIPVATGERLYSRAEFAPVLQAGVAVVQPDPSHAGGITEGIRIAAQAELFDAQLAPHCPLGPVSLAACLQLDLAAPNVLAQEQTLPWHDPGSPDFAVLVDPEVLRPVGGVIPRLTGPGLGVEVDEEAVRALAVAGPLAPGSPVWSHSDGSFAEW
jgi:galactonate dehydratase